MISNIGVVYTEAQIQNTYGQLKFSSCGNKLAAAAGYLDTLDIFDFDILTGEVSNRIALPMPGHIYGVEFSPSEQFVYVTTYYYGYGIIQYDLNAGSVADVIASQTVINSTPDLYALQLGLDGKIYVCKAWGTYLDAVDKPNLPQYDCDYISNAVSLDPNYEGTSAALGLPNFVSSFLGLSACIATNTDEELNIESAGLFPNPSTDQFTLRNLKANSSIEIYDVNGRLIEKFSSSSKSEISFGENFVAGCYIVIVKNEESNSSFKAMKIGKN